MTDLIPLSTYEELKSIEEFISAFLLLPFDRGVPGAVLESILAQVRGGKKLGTYDFIDVLDVKQGIGWQVKSVKHSTPVTWMRAKIPGRAELIRASQASPEAAKRLGDIIIEYCNSHALASIHHYNLQHLIYARLIDHEDGTYTYFERILPIDGRLFDPDAYVWQWSIPKNTTKKEQLAAFHGIHTQTGKPWFAWHGQGENQLHFKGEPNWWPSAAYLCRVDFQGPKRQLTLAELRQLLAKVSL